ncbi:hypothetical protein DFS33DRAFT_1445908 [Desarmillaria ectypa]|nr:hypothetical protein DFS33DRAFT_1445908 [Desarmillaria ectypa]
MSLPQNTLDLSFNLPKRLKPPNLTFTNEIKPVSSIPIQADSPTDLSDDEEDDDILKLDSGDSSPSTSPMAPMLSFSSSDEDAASDDINQGFAALEQLRKSVQKNLRLRPIRSHASLNSAKMRSSFGSFSPQPVREEVASPASSTASSYFTPTSDARDSPSSARWVGSSASDSSSLPRSPSPQQRQSRSVDPGCLYERLTAPTRPLLVDTRPPAVHLSFHIKHSINVAIPSLILKRCRKPGGGFQSLDSLRQFITTEEGKEGWDELMRPGGSWDGDVVVYDDEMDEKDRENMAITAWALLSVIQPLLSYGNVDYLIGGISSAGHHPDLETLIVSGGGLDFGDEPANTGSKGGGLFQLVTNKPFHPKSSLEIEQNSSSMSSTVTAPPRSPLPLMPMTSNYKASNVNVMDASPSPPPSQAAFRRPPPPRRPSMPNLCRIDTKSTERLNLSLPKLHVRTVPLKSATLSVASTSLYPPSPSHLNLAHSNYTPPASAHWVTSPASPLSSAEIFSAYFTPPHTPGTPKGFYIPPSPHTARPDDQPPTTEEPFPPFTVSTILPNFLYLGPELTSPEHVKELRDLGVQRILNIAAECNADDHGLCLKSEFDRYFKIPMRDTVEEENIAQGVREVCEILDDARLHSSPTYVHCKAGKSRSVTAVMAYLIHANHWTLSRAYSFVLERRKGISPNIGFVSELMSFEEEELGGKSVGVQPPSTNGDGTDGDGGGHMNYAVAAGNRRGGHVRESLPPALLGGEPGPLSAGGMEMRVMGDSGQEVEIKDATGRYRHARRAPVDENTLQPMRRVSKAGLESSVSVS